MKKHKARGLCRGLDAAVTISRQNWGLRSTGDEELTREGFVIVDFYSTTCVPCKMLSRILEDLTEDYPFVNIVKVNVTDDPKLGDDNHIEAVPTVKFMRDGAELETVVGLMDEDEIVEKTGARVAFLDRTDANKAFSIAFRTPTPRSRSACSKLPELSYGITCGTIPTLRAIS